MKASFRVCKTVGRVIMQSWLEYWSVEPYLVLRGSRALALKKLLGQRVPDESLPGSLFD